MFRISKVLHILWKCFRFLKIVSHFKVMFLEFCFGSLAKDSSGSAHQTWSGRLFSESWTIFFKCEHFLKHKYFLKPEHNFKVWMLLENFKNRNKFWILNNILECEHFLKNLIMGKESYFFQVSKLFVFSTIFLFLPKRVHTLKNVRGF